mgnify:CR=1 FL=1|jgi:hypothetical protein
MKKLGLNPLSVAIMSASLAGIALPAVGAEINANFKVGGFVKLDVISSGYENSDLPAGNLGRDYYLPSSIPVGDDANESRDIDFHAKSSRINFEIASVVNDKKAVGFFEWDFMTTTGDERVTNAYSPQLRHAYFTYDKWLFGQTWSTFQNAGALPEALDYIGPSEGTVFVRQAQVRYTMGSWQFSVENPETTVTGYQQNDRIVTDDAALPDFVVRYNLNADWGNLVFAGLLRDLNYEVAGTAVDDSEVGLGVSVSGKINIGSRDDLRFMVTSGSGIGRYVGLNTFNDVALNADGDLKAIDGLASFVAYRHLWTDQLRSSFYYSMLQSDHDTALVSSAVTKRVQSLHANLLYSPVTKVTVGVEIMHAERELENNSDGSMNRIQFSAKYDF